MTVSNAGSETGVSSSGASFWRRAINFSSEIGTRADPTDLFGFFHLRATQHHGFVHSVIGKDWQTSYRKQLKYANTINWPNRRRRLAQAVPPTKCVED
jgi:hypothetical protein